GENSPFAAGSIAYAGQIALAEGRPDEAIALLLRAERQLGENQRDDQIVLRLEPDLIVALANLGRLDEARARAARHAEFVASLGAEAPFALANAALLRDYTGYLAGETGSEAAVASGSGMLRLIASEQAARTAGALPIDRRAAIELTMDIAVQSVRPELMLEAMRLINASTIALASKRRRDRLEAGDVDLAQALRRLQDAAAAFEHAEATYLSALARGTAAGVASSTRDDAAGRLAAARNALSERFPEWDDAPTGQDGGLADLAASLGPGEAVLAVAPVYARSFLLLVTRDRVVALESSLPRASMVGLARRLGEAVRAGTFDAEAARALHEAIFSTPVAEALEGIDTLRV